MFVCPMPIWLQQAGVWLFVSVELCSVVSSCCRFSASRRPSRFGAVSLVTYLPCLVYHCSWQRPLFEHNLRSSELKICSNFLGSDYIVALMLVFLGSQKRIFRSLNKNQRRQSWFECLALLYSFYRRNIRRISLKAVLLKGPFCSKEPHSVLKLKK